MDYKCRKCGSEARLKYSLCRSCENTKHKERTQRPLYTKPNFRCGLSKFGYSLLLGICGSKCQICGKPHSEEHRECLYVDHDHNTGEIRGLLCRNCNSAIGLLKDDPQLVSQAKDYI